MAKFSRTFGKTPRFFVNDKEVTAEEYDSAWANSRTKRFGRPLSPGDLVLASNTKSCWPMKSEALACHPNQIEAIMKRDKKHGIPTRRDRMGRPILTSRGHRKALCKLEGVHDNSGGYGDA